MQEETSKETLTEFATERLTTDIVAGVLQPEQKLLIADLKKIYGMGASPLRESLARLSSRGLVVTDTRRGFRVAPISQEDLEDITRVRKLVETSALARCFAFAEDDWKVGIIAAFARLKLIAARYADNHASGHDEIEAAHKQFHTALINGCHSQRLVQMHDNLYDQARRYRHLMLEHVHDMDEFIAQHNALLDVVIHGTEAQACHLISDHLGIIIHKIYPASGGARLQHMPVDSDYQ